MGNPKGKVWNEIGFVTLEFGVCQLLVLNAAQSHMKLLQGVDDVAQYESLMEMKWRALMVWVDG